MRKKCQRAITTVVIYTTEGDVAKFTLLQRATGRRTVLPSDPTLSPDRQRLATADFCAENCDNEVAVWRVTRDSVVKDLVLKPTDKWSDVTAKWKDAGTLVIEYKLDGTPKTLERALSADDWKRPRVSPCPYARMLCGVTRPMPWLCRADRFMYSAA